MNTNWNSKKFDDFSKESLYKVLNSLNYNEIVLVVQQNIFTSLNSLFTFTELTENTSVTKIVTIGDQLETDIKDILSSSPNMNPVFLIDVRLELSLPTQLYEFFKLYHLPDIKVIFTSWDTQRTNDLLNLQVDKQLRVSHFIHSQIESATPNSEITLLPWNVVPMPYIDADVLNCNLLYNYNGMNMYYPKMVSMESATRNILIDNMANSLQSLLKNTNTVITQSVAIGEESKKLVHLLKRRIEGRRSSDEKFEVETMYNENKNAIKTDLIVVERSIDPLTPLLTQLTYAGILDDLYDLGADEKLKDKDIALKFRVDDIWEKLKFLNFGALGPRLNQMAKDLQNKYDSRHNADSIGEIKQFVDSLGSLQERQRLLKLHTTLSSDVLHEVENNDSLQFNKILDLEQNLLLDNIDYSTSLDIILGLIYEEEIDSDKLIRVICIFSLCRNGIKDKDYDTIKKELIESFGIEICFQLERLAYAGLFINKSMFVSFQKEKKSFNQINDITLVWNKEYKYISKWLDTLPEEDSDNSENHNVPTNPKEATFAYCGVIPLLYRLIQSLYDRSIMSKHFAAQQPFIISAQPDLSMTEDLYEQIFGNAKIAESIIWNMDTKITAIKSPVLQKMNFHNNDKVLITFLGGITLSEIAVLKFLQEKLKAKNVNKRFIIISDGIINGTRIINGNYYRTSK
ncbi:hypothetical protein Kpol_483p19 [Vanderwaltozyma polyspora DSM 70294]|uniref:Vacuolar protein sorting-associated protein 33 n=1 Tax=Vanderwaltozyma polyspora (strain ATCC 22028 / DSM 70294 / BCRC 21397 / CBS 2163 / NBRC 10782 / NRRL Y-8283 / UCD 57-17) TaxID=436907 RepID=A7TQ71_VANPO|nr:uncharacterized protein Kpol_483p19 [Vanderwaltozyma polyspora DSM 70294]EDO15600.1 hypothetical protein Kpol_483p19 [Vanderwaltozyma polyspora DSM 70294]